MRSFFGVEFVSHPVLQCDNQKEPIMRRFMKHWQSLPARNRVGAVLSFVGLILTIVALVFVISDLVAGVHDDSPTRMPATHQPSANLPVLLRDRPDL